MNFTSCSLYERGPPLNTFPVCVCLHVFRFLDVNIVLLKGKEEDEVDSHPQLFASSGENSGPCFNSDNSVCSKIFGLSIFKCSQGKPSHTREYPGCVICKNAYMCFVSKTYTEVRFSRIFI